MKDLSLASLSPIILLPSQYYEVSSRKAHVTPEKTLQLAVLESAIDDIQRYCEAKRSRERRLFHEALTWLLSEEEKPPFSFVVICQALSLEPAYVRKKVLARQKWATRKELFMKTNSDSRKSSRPSTKEGNSAPASTRGHQRTARSPSQLPSARRPSRTRRSSFPCPKCTTPLRQRFVRDVTIDECPTCHGIWLDKGEFEQASRTGGEKWIGQFVVDLAKMIANPAPFQDEEQKQTAPKRRREK